MHATTIPLNINVNIKLLPRMFSAHSLSLRPKTMDIREAEPTPMSEPKAWMMFISGKVMAKPAMASAPTPRPMKMRSTILYIEAMTWLITAGSAYFHSSAPMSRVSSSLVLSVVSNTVLYYIKVHKNKPRRYTFFWFTVYCLWFTITTNC